MEGTAYDTTAFPTETEAGLQTVDSDSCQYFMQKLQFLFFPNNFILDCVEDPNKIMYLLRGLVNLDH